MQVDIVQMLNWKNYSFIIPQEWVPLITLHFILDKLNHWDMISNGGNRWAVENPPKGADTLPTSTAKYELRPNFCFATSYHSCSKQQIIDFRAEGLTGAFLDKIQPIIHVSEWYVELHFITSLYFDSKGKYGDWGLRRLEDPTLT